MEKEESRAVFRGSRLAGFGALVFALLLVGAGRAEAQDVVYSPSELTKLPKIASPARVKSLVESSYPAALREKGVGGKVQLQFVIGPDGKVEPGTVEVVSATVPELVEPAKEVAKKLEFTPGEVGGKPVRTRVVLPIVYTAGG
ncbi:MAG TPA: energy transducer TonB [Longimicrobiales bacterium]